jgi:signal transduction histidine kinase
MTRAQAGLLEPKLDSWSVESTLHNSDGVAVSVTDRGPRVQPAERETIFDSFADFDTRGRAGLGLAIAKTVIEGHRGQIWVEDPPGQGARFVFTLPFAPDNGTKR